VPEPVDWSADGVPRSLRFGDVYRSTSGALAQARHVFLQGSGLPAAWSDRPRWTVLETGFGLGLNFLATWRAWKDDPHRPRLLHFVSCEAFPVAAQDLLRSASAHPELAELAAALARAWWGLVPGLHRLSFEQGQVLLTIGIGDARAVLAELAFAADTVFLDGFDPQRNPQLWAPATLRAVARLCRRGTCVATWTVAGQVRRDLQQCGFQVERVPGLPPKRECLRGRYDPPWVLRQAPWPEGARAGTALVVGGGLAGASAAASLARRGWQVQVLDRSTRPAAGASGLPAGLLAPHTSPDDGLLSRLSRAGVRMTLQQVAQRLREGEDWAPTGVLERRSPQARAAADLGPEAVPWQEARPEGLHHQAGAWIKPARLVEAWLRQPGVQWNGGQQVARLQRLAEGWAALDADGAALAQAQLAVVAGALDSAPLLGGRIVVQPVRGQVSWAPLDRNAPLAPSPVNGNGHFLPCVPLDGEPAWLSGSSYVRGDRALDERPAEHQANLERLQQLVPEVGSALAPAFAHGRVRAWTGVRCASTDRRPLLGELEPGLWVSTAMGSRGLTFAWLCAELLTARLHGEPLPLPVRMAAALDVARQQPSRESPYPA
jgi:tRNA 5-methylaminomethyl-2-thiouridine biosynthesis bifunctional protein